MPSKKKFKAYGILLLALLPFLSTGCSSKGCYDDMTVRMFVYFYEQQQGTDVSVSLDSFNVQGVGSDSILYQNANRDGVELYLNPSTQTSRFAFSCQQNGQTIRDTLTIEHSNQPWFQSLECGSMMFSTIRQATVSGPLFKGIVVLDSTVNTTRTKHVKLYL